MTRFRSAKRFWKYAKNGDTLAPGAIKKMPPLFPKIQLNPRGEEKTNEL